MKPVYWDSFVPLIELKGKGVKSFLHGQISADILGLKEGKIIKACWLSPIGRMRALLEVKLGKETAEVIVLTGKVDDLITSLEAVIFPFDEVSITAKKEVRRIQEICDDISWQLIDAQWNYLDQDLNIDLEDLESISSKDFEEWRIKQGFPYFLNEINGATNPFELGLCDLIDLKKGCYLGQETLSKLSNLGRLKQEIRFWESTIEIEIESFLYPYKNQNENSNNRAAQVTSSFQINDQYYIGLALVKRDMLANKFLFLPESEGKVRLSVPQGFMPLKGN